MDGDVGKSKGANRTSTPSGSELPTPNSELTDRGHLLTEHVRDHAKPIDTLSSREIVERMHEADATITHAVANALDSIAATVDLVVDALRAGGRLIYIGAGTSGRLGVLDASECPPTFCSDPAQIVGIIAGGDSALRRSSEGAEDVPENGAAAMDDVEVAANDVVVGIASGGTTPYVHGAIARAKQRGAKTVFFACVPAEQVSSEADVEIRVLTGPELIAGSTRLKAGTATKMVLNMITTAAFVRIGKTYGPLMIDLSTRSAKLTDRGVRIVRRLTDLDRPGALDLLHAAGGEVKTALVMHHRACDAPTARRLLEENDGHPRRIIG